MGVRVQGLTLWGHSLYLFSCKIYPPQSREGPCSEKLQPTVTISVVINLNHRLSPRPQGKNQKGLEPWEGAFSSTQAPASPRWGITALKTPHGMRRALGDS